MYEQDVVHRTEGKELDLKAAPKATVKFGLCALCGSCGMLNVRFSHHAEVFHDQQVEVR